MFELAQNPWAVFNWLWVILITGSVVTGLAWLLVTYIRLTDQGKRHEAVLSTTYLEAQNHLTHSIMLIGEMIQINKKESETLGQALSDAVTGRYMSSGPAHGRMLNFLQENYPDLRFFNASFDRIDAAVSESHRVFTQIQNKLLLELRAFEQWRTGTFMARVLMKRKFPDSDLKARAGGEVYEGAEALEKMYQIIQTGKGIEIYRKGTHAPGQLY